jgi:hypothetical protein
VRLTGCIFVELVLGTTLATGLAFGAYAGVRALDRLTVGGSSAHAERPPPLAATVLDVPLDRALPPGRLPSSHGYFLGLKDEVLLAPLVTQPVKRVRFNRGGSSISLRLEFADGSRAAFKPNQTNAQTVPRYEVAAFRINRMLGLSAVAPAAARRFTRAELLDVFDMRDADLLPRFNAEVVPDADGQIAGEMSWWIPVIVDAQIEDATIDSPEGVGKWRQYLTVGEPEPWAARHLLPQISSMVAFDYLINNSDRFSGSNCKGSPDGRMVFYMDNALAFGPTLEGVPRVRWFLERAQKFSRLLHTRVKELTWDRLREAMTTDTGPYEQLLTEAEMVAVMYRRDELLKYLDGLIERHGEAAVLVYP